MYGVSRSQNIEQDILHNEGKIWLFYNVHHTGYCQVYYNINGLHKTVSISYHVQLGKSIKDMMTVFRSKKSTLKEMIRHFAIYVSPIRHVELKYVFFQEK